MTRALSGRVLVLGLDMGDGPLIRHWSRTGRLPNLAALQSAGTWLDLESTAEVLHTSTWPTFATGTLPGRHGVYYPYQPTPGQQLARHIKPDQYGVESFWTRAHGEGSRAIVYDVPETFPDARFGGSAVFDWGTWAWYGEPAAQPPALLGELRSRFGRYPLGLEAKRLAFRVPDGLEERLLRSVRYKAASAAWLLESREWDVAVIGLCETHPAGHYLWPARAAATPDDPAFDPLRRVYMAVDDAIGALSKHAPPDTTVLVVSGDGVRPNRCGWHLLPQVLDRLGFSGSAPTPDSAATPRRSLVSRAPEYIPAWAKRAVTGLMPWQVRDRLGVWLQTRGVDWGRTRAFTLPTDLEGCIRINLRGREPHGIVDPGAEYQQICAEIRTRLEELENPATGRPAVGRVWCRNDVFPGPRQEELPDLIVTWNDDAPIDAVASRSIGRVDGVNADPRPGTHSTSGFALAAGPGIRGGADDRAHLADVAATILTRLGVSSTGLDGRAIPALTGPTLVPAGNASSADAPTSSPTEMRGR